MLVANVNHVVSSLYLKTAEEIPEEVPGKHIIVSRFHQAVVMHLVIAKFYVGTATAKPYKITGFFNLMSNTKAPWESYQRLGVNY